MTQDQSTTLNDAMIDAAADVVFDRFNSATYDIARLDAKAILEAALKSAGAPVAETLA